MPVSPPAKSSAGNRVGRKPFRVACDSLEDRVFLSATPSHPAQVHHLSSPAPKVPLETLGGTITNQISGKGVKNVRVELIDLTGAIAKTTFTDGKGYYQFKTPGNRPYVIREVTPKGVVQAFPTFAYTAPTGAYAPGTGAKNWNYKTGNTNPGNGPVGPIAWSSIAPAGTLPFESPINITGPTIDLGKVLTINYANSVPKAIINNGAQIQTQFASTAPDTITLGGLPYTLSQFHYHDPAENHVNGVTYSMEEHFVNVSASGATTVLAVFLQLGPHNNALDPIFNAASTSLTTSGSTTTISTPIDFAGLLPSSTQGWYYQGSLTTPPLSQVVNWLVFATPITLDYQQLVEYEAVANGVGFLPSARPIQPADGRQLNEVDYDLYVLDTSISGLNFVLGYGNPTGTQTSLGSSNLKPLTTPSVHSPKLPVAQESPTPTTQKNL